MHSHCVLNTPTPSPTIKLLLCQSFPNLQGLLLKHKIQPLGPFINIHMYMCMALTIWNWTSSVGVQSWRKLLLLSNHESSCGFVMMYVTAFHLECDMCNLPCHCWHVSCFHGDLTLGTALPSCHGCVFPILPRNHCLATGIWGLWIFRAFFPPSFLFPGPQSRSCIVDVSVRGWHSYSLHFW